MLQLPLRRRFVVVAYLQLPRMRRMRGPHGQRADHLALVPERIELHLMLAAPTVLPEPWNSDSLVGDVRVLEGELGDAERAQARRCIATTARGPSTYPRAMTQVARTLSGPAAASRNVGERAAAAAPISAPVGRRRRGVPRVAEVGQPASPSRSGQLARQERAVGEAGDLVENAAAASRPGTPPSSGPQQRLAAAGDDQPRRPRVRGRSVVGLDVQPIPVDAVALQGADRRLGDAVFRGPKLTYNLTH